MISLIIISIIYIFYYIYSSTLFLSSINQFLYTTEYILNISNIYILIILIHIMKQFMEGKKMEIKNLKSGNFNVNCKSKFDIDSSDYIILTITQSEDLNQLIKQVIIDSTTESRVYEPNAEEPIIRYKVKGWLYNSLSSLGSYSKDVLFLKDFVDNKKIELKFMDLYKLDSLITELRYATKQVVETALKYNDLDVNISIKVEVRQNE